MEYHPLVEKIKSILKERGVWFESFEHEPVRTSEDAARIRDGYSLGQGAKAIIVRVKLAGGGESFAMLVLSGDRRFDNEKVKRLLGAKDVRFAAQNEIRSIGEGVEAGGIPPFGNLFGIKVIADPKLLSNKKIVFNAGDRRYSIAMESKDYVEIVGPEVAPIT